MVIDSISEKILNNESSEETIDAICKLLVLQHNSVVHYKDPHVSAIEPAPEHVIWIRTIKSIKLVFTLLNRRQYGTQA